MAPRKKYTSEQMRNAIEAVKNGEKVATAAKTFGVPRITLHDKVTGKTTIGCSMGPSTVLTKSEEDVLVRWLIALSEKHIPMTKENLLDSVQKIITEQKRPNPFTNNRPSKKWFQSFLKRHPELTQKIPDSLTRARDNVTENGIRNWFKEIEQYLEENNLKGILDDPNRIFNSDESAFFLSPKPGRVLAKKGEKNLYSACGDDKENLTVLITGNAAGLLAPPMIIYNYERVPASITAGIPDEWAVGKSESGWMCSSTFYEYMTNIFNPWLEQNNIEKPILFFLDGHKSHLTLHLSKFCSENKIEVIALYPNSTHILQPMDLSVFRPLKVYWKKAVNEWKMKNLGQNLRKENFASVLQKALTKITKECIKNGFRAGGLFPFGPDYIDMTKIKHNQLSTTNKTINPAQTEFMKYLEKEIITIFSIQKLQQYNDFFYKDRKTLDSSLPNEDMALYMIWAKTKAECHSNLPACNENILIENPPCQSVIPPVEAVKNLQTSDTQTKVQNISEDTHKDISTNPLQLPTNHTMDTVNLLKIIKDSNMEIKIQEEVQCVDSLPLSSNTSKNDNTTVGQSSDFLLSLPAEKDKILTRPSLLASELFSSSQSYNYIEANNKTPHKNTMANVLGVMVPSPFKKSLFWPEEEINKKKRIKREKIPSTVTSKAWKEYYEKKEIEKIKKLEEKEKRAKERMEKKKLKEQQIENKRNNSLKVQAKKRTREVSTSEDTDLEITFAESDDSYNVENDEGSDIENAKKNIYSHKSKYKLQSPLSDSDADNLSINKLISRQATESHKKFFPGNFVIVLYEGEYFPGKIQNIVSNNKYEVSTMILTKGNTFRWPNTPDKILYSREEIIEVIKEPICLNKRGFYRILEMDKYLPDIYGL